MVGVVILRIRAKDEKETRVGKPSQRQAWSVASHTCDKGCDARILTSVERLEIEA